MADFTMRFTTLGYYLFQHHRRLIDIIQYSRGFLQILEFPGANLLLQNDLGAEYDSRSNLYDDTEAKAASKSALRVYANRAEHKFHCFIAPIYARIVIDTIYDHIPADPDNYDQFETSEEKLTFPSELFKKVIAHHYSFARCGRPLRMLGFPHVISAFIPLAFEPGSTKRRIFFMCSYLHPMIRLSGLSILVAAAICFTLVGFENHIASDY
jgi:hypothetical protein